MVRAKFKVRQKTENENGVHEVILCPVINGSEENKSFYKYTPAGEIKLSVVNAETAENFIVNKEYYIDFTPAD